LENTANGVPGLKIERARVGEAPHAMRDPLGLKTMLDRGLGGVRDGAGGVPRQSAVLGWFWCELRLRKLAQKVLGCR
jgi:hypothetical protein